MRFASLEKHWVYSSAKEGKKKKAFNCWKNPSLLVGNRTCPLPIEFHLGSPNSKTNNYEKKKASFPDAEDKYWIKYLQDNKAKEGERLEDAAKFLSGMISISLAIFLKINDQAFAVVAQSCWAVVVVCLWLLSLALSFLVFFPFGYHYNEQSAASIEAFHGKMVRRKRGLLLAATVCFFGALLVLGGLFLMGYGTGGVNPK